MHRRSGYNGAIHFTLTWCDGATTADEMTSLLEQTRESIEQFR